jgi:putative ABC transport system permease protein
MNFTLRLYRRLAEAFPHEFKLVYGADLMRLGEDAVQEIGRLHGVAGLMRLLADIAIRLPLEYLSEMRRDMRYAVRALIKSPGFALVGIISLGLGMGVATSVFSKAWNQLFRDLPGASYPQELVMPQNAVSYYYIEQYRAQKSLFAEVAAFQNGVPFNVAFEGNASAKPERIFGQLVSPEYFSVLGAKPQRGRLLSPAMDKPGGAPVVVITDRFWRDRLNSSADALGQTLRLNGQAATIVGIMPKDFKGALPVVPADLFVPTTVPAALAPELANDVLHKRDAKAFQAIMRMAPGVTIESAEAGLDTVTRRLDEQDASNLLPAVKGRRVTLVGGGTIMPIPRALKPVVIGFLVVLIGLILTIACMNLANMLLARGAARRKELAIRMAVGASRFRLIRQMLSEGILLAMLGGLAGLGLAYGLTILSSRVSLPQAVPSDFDYRLDWHALAFTFALVIVSGIGFSLAPALQATQSDLAPTLKEGATVQLRGFRRFGMRNLLVVSQVAGSLMLLLITGFLVVGISTVNSVGTNFDANTMCLLSIDPVRDGYSPEKAEALFERLGDRLKGLAAVRSIAMAEQAPFSIPSRAAQVIAASQDSRDPSRTLELVSKERVSAGYFAALSEPMLGGREFVERDQWIEIPADGSKMAPLPIVLNESAARRLFGNSNSIGQRVMEDKQTYDVVGLVRDLSSGIPDEDQPPSMMYLPLTRRDFASPPAGGMTVMVRSDAGADALVAIRREIGSIDPNLAIFDVRTLGEYLERTRSVIRLALDVYGGIGVFGLVLAAIGLAGVTAYAVARRRKEIGIRMALGARKGQVLRLVLREGAALVSVGTAMGFLGAMAMVKMLSSLTSIFTGSFNVSTSDPRLVVGAPLLLGGLAMLACYIPARRSTKIDPVKALREE